MHGEDEAAALSLWEREFLVSGEDVRAGARGASAAHELLDDAQGRFAIDCESGVITLADPGSAKAQLGDIHPVRTRTRYAIGAAYDAAFHLRIVLPLPIAVLPNGEDPLARFEQSTGGAPLREASMLSAAQGARQVDFAPYVSQMEG